MWEHDSFAAGLESEFIFVYLDFPRSEELQAAVPNPERNDELQKKYGIQGFPTVLLMTAEGEVFGQTGYRRVGPEEYVTHVKELAESGKVALKKVAELEKAYADAEDKAAIVNQAIEMLSGLAEGSAGAGKLADLVRKGFELDPANEAGLKLAALKALFAQGQARDAEFTMAEELDPKNEAGLLEQVVFGKMNQVRDDESATAFIATLQEFLKLDAVTDKNTVATMCAMVAMWCDRMLERPEDALFFAKKAEEIGGLDERMVQMVQAIIEKSAS